jgi:hypothetical protein
VDDALKALVDWFGMDVAEYGDGVVWVRVSASKKRLYTLERLREMKSQVERREVMSSPCPAIHDRPKQDWVDFHKRRDDTHQCIPDMQDERARKTWRRYVTLPDGREGPAPFESKSEQKEYEAAYGFRVVEPDQRREERAREKLAVKPKTNPYRTIVTNE